MTDRIHQQIDAPTLVDPDKGSRYALVVHSQLPALRAGEFVDDLTAVQLAICSVIDAANIVVLNRQRLITDGVRLTTTCSVDRFFFDLPDAGVSHETLVPSFTIAAAGETKIELAGETSGQQIDEETVDTYGEGTVLQQVGEAQTRMSVLGILPTKDDRAAIRKALIDSFIGEPELERPGRVIPVPLYYDQTVRLDLVGVDYPDDLADARANRWPLQLTLDATTTLVRLVPTPPYLRPSVGVDVVPASEDL